MSADRWTMRCGALNERKDRQCVKPAEHDGEHFYVCEHGKHAMCGQCEQKGWPVVGYLAGQDPEVATLRARLAAVERLAEEWGLGADYLAGPARDAVMNCARALRAVLGERKE